MKKYKLRGNRYPAEREYLYYEEFCELPKDKQRELTAWGMKDPNVLMGDTRSNTEFHVWPCLTIANMLSFLKEHESIPGAIHFDDINLFQVTWEQVKEVIKR